MDKFKQKLEQFKQWTRENGTEIVVWSAAGSCMAGVVYQLYGAYRTGKYYDDQMKLMREAFEHAKERDAAG